ncbi:bifunctional glycosyltransferase/CDP-glycerol:glycerophosphate glycerophosphotransferase [Mammaliicoccus sciuri]|uniref:bifunctional glycosyltransferase/CDP-glycerol:glycerophosphate glycerophosphotransferase n=1 Tax=Mammaliicoccus sciuri TaxID=1296 RepID=UPI001FB20084|nr:CDP-glycerol glycerophosphotransferase family protein [Mammaliicoccus sciuri]MCJ0950946.1 CDP-glycerol:glycerophosphate glycerophosphotransferase [Mammaliicoccus sciuri]
MSNKMKVSVIIPVYNAEEYIVETLESVKSQTFKEDFEVILINDGSEDDSMNLVKEFIKNNDSENIHYKIHDDGENKGQGARRNLGVDIATGESILFLDSDDLIEHNTLDIAYKRLIGTKENDFVIFEWAYYYPETGETKYVNRERYNLKLALYRNTVEMLLGCSTYFSVNKLYKRSFLQNHNIRYGEGYIYEDFEFYVACALKAYRVPVISNILYKVRVHDNSTTKTDYTSTKHRDSFLIAIENAASKLQDGYRDPYTPYQVNKYFIYRALLYSEKRLPNDSKMKNEFIKSTMKIINEYSPNIKVPNGVLPLYHYAFSKGVIKNLEVAKMKKLFKLHKNNKINFYYSREIEKAKRKSKITNKIKENYYLKPLIYNTRRKVHARRNKKRASELENYMNLKLKQGNIIMMGFDYQYRGNSKYLFDYLKDHYSSENLKFVTFDKKVPDEYRINPRSKDFFNYFYTSNIVICESWVPAGFKKKQGQKWIQLWHGTPFKKMLFDSNEATMLSLNPNHKVKMKNDISRWDYMIADSDIAKQKFETSFDIASDKIVTTGYPRNEWLKENHEKDELIREIKIKNNIPLDKKIILYAPTWRDYNYKVAESRKDKNYMIQFRKLLNHLGNDYCIINKAHSMDTQPSWNNGITQVFTVNDKVETQELLAISDVIISDYSSIYLDAIHINKPFYFLIKDYPKFNISRGVYLDMYNDILKLVAKDEVELAKKIKSNVFKDFNAPEKYLNNNIETANESIAQIISDNIK